MSQNSVFLSNDKRYIHIHTDEKYRFLLTELTAKPMQIDKCIIRMFCADNLDKIYKTDILFDNAQSTTEAFSMIMDFIPDYLRN